jgi:hypothetical protein
VNQGGSPAEAIGTAAAGAALGAAAGSVVGLAMPLAVVAGLNGAISGWRGTYDWKSGKGVAAFALDSTWAGLTTAAGVVANGVGLLRRDSGYHAGLSHRQNRHVYSRGLQLRKGFATSFGNVVAGAGDLTRARRARLVTDHEDVHVWQARWFGPAYPILYGGWLAGGAAAGAAVWATVRREQRVGKVIESCAYYLNPFEWWAYSRDGRWPPSGLVDRLGWKQPAVNAFAAGARRSADAQRVEPFEEVAEIVGD